MSAVTRHPFPRFSNSRFIFGIFVVLACLLVLLLFMFLAPAALAASMYTLQDDATGGDCVLIGAWNDATNTCTLNTDIAVAVAGDTGIEVVDSGIKLDGNGHLITGLGATFPPPDPGIWVPEFGIVLNSVTNSEVRNFKITNIDAGIQINGGSENLVIGNEIRDDTHGVWLVMSTLNKVTNNLMGNNMWASVDLAAANGNEIQGNTIQLSTLWGIRSFEGNDNVISGNSISNMGTPAEGAGTCIYLFYGAGNNVNSNLLEGAHYGVDIDNSVENGVTNNHFASNTVQAEDDDGSSFFDLPSGGNRWDDFDEPSEGCFDVDVNGFCDAPYAFTGNQDNLPRVGRPDLRLFYVGAYWESYAAYLAHDLSVDYEVTNAGAVGALDAKVIGTISTGGVTNASALPLLLGNIEPSASVPATLHYDIPEGTVSFNTTVYLQARNAAGTWYLYPGGMAM